MSIDNTIHDFIKKEALHTIDFQGQSYRLRLEQYVAYFFIHIPGFFPGCQFRVGVDKTVYEYLRDFDGEIYYCKTFQYTAGVNFGLFAKGQDIPITGSGKTIEDAIENLLKNCSEYSEQFKGKFQSEDFVFDYYSFDYDPNFTPSPNELENIKN